MRTDYTESVLRLQYAAEMKDRREAGELKLPSFFEWVREGTRQVRASREDI